MPILAYGLNHKTASIALRERVAIAAEALNQTLMGARNHVPDLDELFILSTCNRTEVYCALREREHRPVHAWLAAQRNIEPKELEQASYALWDDAAVRHMSRVAAGLDSMVLGEPQIFGQLKTAYDFARSAGVIGTHLDRLSQHCFRIAKRVRTHTDIGRSPISVAYAAVTLAEQIFTDLASSQALLLGAGDTTELVARHLRERGVRRIVIANRTLLHARALANEVGGEAISLGDVPAYLAQSDIVFSSTASPLPILGKGTVEQALKKRRHRPLFMVDIAVPRDIEPEVADLRDVFLYTIDDLSAIIEDNVRSRRRAAEEAEVLIEEGVAEYQREQLQRSGQDTLKAFRRHAEELRDEELQRALQELSRGGNAADLMKRLAHGLTNKLIHKPTVAIREAGGGEDRDRVIRAVKKLFALDAPSE